MTDTDTFHLRFGAKIAVDIYTNGEKTTHQPIEYEMSTEQMDSCAESLNMSTATGSVIQTCGETLFDAIFKDSARSKLIDSLSNLDVYTRILLEFDYTQDAKYARLPWEFMSVTLKSGNRVWLATSRRCILARYVSPHIPKRSQPPAIKIALASPDENDSHDYRSIDIEVLWETLSKLDKEKSIDLLPRIDRMNLSKLSEHLDESPTIIHLIAHGEPNPPRVIMVEQKDVIKEVATSQVAEKFMGMKLDLLVLQLCNSAIANGQYSEITAPFLDLDINYIVAMQHTVKVYIANRFSEMVYKTLAELNNLELSLQRGREYIADLHGNEKIYFAIPVIFTHVLIDTEATAPLDIDITVDDIQKAFDQIVSITLEEPWKQAENRLSTIATVCYYNHDEQEIHSRLYDAVQGLSPDEVDEQLSLLGVPRSKWRPKIADRRAMLMTYVQGKPYASNLHQRLRQTSVKRLLPKQKIEKMTISIQPKRDKVHFWQQKNINGYWITLSPI